MNNNECLNISFPDYDCCVVNVSSTILRYFGAPTNHNAIPKLLDKLKKGNYKKIVLFVFDGMGSYNIDANLSNGFLQNHKMMDISSVFPPTTVAALSSIDSELYPSEHGRLGWTRWFDKEQTLENGFTIGLTNKYYPYIGIDKILKKFKIKNTSVSPFAKYKRFTLDGITNCVINLCKRSNHKFIYAYFNEPDAVSHRKGCTDLKTRSMLEQIDNSMRYLQASLPDDVAVIVTADHGLIDIKSQQFIDEYPSITECLAAPPSIEPTAISFRVKSDKNEQFASEFNKHIAGFKLMTKQEVIDNNLFGKTSNIDKLSHALGDYFAVSIGENVLWFDRSHQFIAVHGGLHKGELQVPLILFDNKMS